MLLIASFNTKIKGTVTIKPHGVKPGSWIIIELNGFLPHKTHAIHLHEFGDSSNGCISMGGHWNPHKVNHGKFINKEPYKSDTSLRHAGDLVNNITSNANGEVYFKYHDPLIPAEEVIGRSIVIHKGIDDLGLGGNEESLKTGNAGERIACAIIGRAK